MMPRNTIPVTIRRATTDDAARLAVLAEATFTDTFAADNTPDDMALYLARTFGEAMQRAELSDSRNVAFFAERAGDLVGYAMLREGPAPDSVAAPDATEIVRLYAVKQFIGAGVGAALMQRCLDHAAARGRGTIWLGVWEHNTRAIAFYIRWGFTDVGTLPFTLGHDRQTDRVMTRRTGEER
jgi:ribosomal protein S18 acetylase RimI-like enzyme